MAEVDQVVSFPDAAQLLEDLVKHARNPFESNFAAGFVYRVQAVAPGVHPSTKAALYEKAAGAFSQAARDATSSLHGLAEARAQEHAAFALITHAGTAAEPQARVVLYERAWGLLSQALTTLPERYKKTRSHLLGWGALCRAKARGILADEAQDLRRRAAAHEECAALFAGSAEHFRDAGQASLASVSIAWQYFSVGWSAYFGGDRTAAEDEFRRALVIFQESGRHDLLSVSIECLAQIGMAFEPETLAEPRPNKEGPHDVVVVPR